MTSFCWVNGCADISNHFKTYINYLSYKKLFFAGNDFIIPVRGIEQEMSKLATRVLEELVRPLKELNITETEFVCLKTIVFLAPGESGIT